MESKHQIRKTFVNPSTGRQVSGNKIYDLQNMSYEFFKFQAPNSNSECRMQNAECKIQVNPINF